MPHAIIFDIDGTLLDSVDLHAKAWQEAFAHFGRNIPFNRIRHEIGKGGDQLLPVFLSEDELETKGKQIEEYRSHLFKEKYLKDVRSFPSVRDLFQRIRGEGVRIALASSARGDELAAYTALARIGDLVETETSSNDAEHSKPHPDIFEAALGRLGSPPAAEVVVVGDTPYDAEAATKAGIRNIVGVLCGGFPEEELREEGCKAIFLDP